MSTSTRRTSTRNHGACGSGGRKAGGALPLVILALSIGTAGLGLLVASSTSMRTATSTLLTPSTAEIERLIAASGVTPKSLAASGVNQAGAQETVSDAKTHIVANYNAIQDDEAVLRNARNTYNALLRTVQSGLATQQQITALNTARTALDAAESAWDAELDAIYEAAVADLSSAQKNTLATITGHSHWGHPIQYHAAERTEADWVELRHALAHVRIAAKLGETPIPAVQQVVTTADAHSAVSAANTGLNNLASVQAGWDAGL